MLLRPEKKIKNVAVKISGQPAVTLILQTRSAKYELFS